VTVVQSTCILELLATDEIHMEDRKNAWLELSPKLIRPMAYKVRKTVNRVARKQLHLTNKMKNNKNIERHKLDQIDARNL